MPIQILMPALSPTMTEGNLVRWLKKEGDTIKSGEVLAEIETDKATMEVEAVDEGTLGKIVVPAGTEGVQVNALIALILEEDEDASALTKFQESVTRSQEPGAKNQEAGTKSQEPEIRDQKKEIPLPAPCFQLPIPAPLPAPWLAALHNKTTWTFNASQEVDPRDVS